MNKLQMLQKEIERGESEKVLRSLLAIDKILKDCYDVLKYDVSETKTTRKVSLSKDNYEFLINNLSFLVISAEPKKLNLLGENDEDFNNN